MKIKEIFINSYGMLRDKKISFSDSINIIEGKNESGKSTVMSFISFIFYGGNENPELIKMAIPGCGGYLRVSTSTHGDLQIERYASISGKKYSDNVNVFKYPSMQEIKISGSVGEFLLGINKQFFTATTFVSQGCVSEYSSKNINDSMQNILLSASESYNTDKAQKKLDEVRKFFALKRGRGGVISELEDKISALKRDAEDNSMKSERLSALQMNLKNASEKKSTYSELLTEIFAEKQARTYNKIKARENELAEKRELAKGKELEYSKTTSVCDGFASKNTRSRLRDLELKYKFEFARITDLENSVCAERNPVYDDSLDRYTEEKRSALIQNLTKHRKTAQNIKYATILSAVFSFIFIGLFVASLVFQKNVFAVAFLIVTAIFISSTFILMHARKKIQDDISALLAPYKYTPMIKIYEIESDFSEKIYFKNDYEKKAAALKEKKALLEESEKRLQTISEELCALIAETTHTDVSEPLDEHIESAENTINSYNLRKDTSKNELNTLYGEINDLTDFLANNQTQSSEPPTENPKFKIYSDTELDTVLKRTSSEINLLSEAIIRAEKEISSLSESVIPQNDYDGMIISAENELTLSKERLDIVLLADEAIKFSSENIKSAVTPQLIVQCDRLFSAITEDRYSGIGISEDIYPTSVKSDITLKNDELSYGTSEAMYLSFRTALIMVLCKNEFPPLMLDETFAHIDNARTAEIIKLVAESGIQSVIFTCHDRESRLLQDFGVDFSHIIL